MFSIDEKRELRTKFWLRFKTFSNRKKLKAGKSGKWIMDKTGIKQLSLKFHFDEEVAWAGIEVDTRNLDKRISLFDKLEKLNKILSETVPHKLIWDLEVNISDTKTVSRVYAEKLGVNIYNEKNWAEVYVFLYEVMNAIEDVFLEYQDYLKYQ